VAAALAALLAAPAWGQASKAWSQFRANPQGTSQAAVVGAQTARPEPGFPAPLPVAPNPSGFAPGGVAVGATGVAFVGQGSTLSAYSPSGKRFWTYNASTGGGDVAPNVTTPALSTSGSTVYALSVTFNLFVPTPSTLVALNAGTGALRWSAPVGLLATALGTAQPTVTVGPDGSLYVVSDVAGAVGAGPDNSAGPITNATVTDFSPYGSVNWSTTISGPVAGGPVLDTGGNVYVSVTGGSAGGQVVSLSPSGGLNWATALGTQAAAGYLGTAPVVSPGGSTVFVATRGPNGALYALGTSDGAVLGAIGSGGITGTPALSTRIGNLYAGTPSSLVTALPSGGGSAAWATGAGSQDSVNAPAIRADGTVYASNGDTLLAVSGTTGAIKWSYTSGSSGIQLSSPAIGPSGDVYVTTDSLGQGTDQLLAFAGPP
jgi:outer membrane protein assembly factor BamB